MGGIKAPVLDSVTQLPPTSDQFFLQAVEEATHEYAGQRLGAISAG